MNHSARKVLAGLGIAVMAAAVAGPVAAQSPAASGAAGPYRIGITNPGSVGNGWREEMLCSAQAQGVASGNVSEVKILNEETDPAGQLNHIRTLIADGVDAILVNPSSPDALNPAIKEATDQGIVVIAIDAPVTEPSAYNLSNDQENYGYLGAKWLFEQLGNQGKIVYMRGAAGHPADTARDVGFKRAVEEAGDGIEIVSETQTGWLQATAVEQITNLINSGTEFDGVWTSGIDNVIVDELKKAGINVPVVGADNVGFVQQLLDTEGFPGLKGAAVTNPGSVGGAGVTLALQILGGQLPESNTVVLTPEVWDNTTPEGIEKLTAANDPSLNPIWPLGLMIPDWTTYTKEQLLACKGPGE